MVESSFTSNCTNLTASQLEATNQSRCISAMVCTVLTFLILLALLFSKAYKTTLQRLFLYLTVVDLFQLVFISMEIELQFTFKQRESMCVGIALLNVWSATSTYLFAGAITLYLVYLVYSKLRKKPVVKSNVKWRVVFEISLTIFCVLSPIAYLWVPFYHGSYGDAMVSCWIIDIKLSDCKHIGFRDQIGYSYGIFYGTSFVIMIAFAGVAILFCTFAARYKLTRRHHLRTICRTLTLLSFMTATAFVEVFGLIDFLYSTITGKEIPFKLLIIMQAAVPFSQMNISLGFLVYVYSFGCKNSHCLYGLLGRRRHKVKHEQINTGLQATAQSSSRPEVLSFTQSISQQYTGEFTSMTTPLMIDDKQKHYDSTNEIV